MTTSQIIQTTYPALRLLDKVSFALQLMEDYNVLHLPVKSDDKYVGLVSKQDILDAEDTDTLASLQDLFIMQFASTDDHLLNIVKTISTNQLSLLPIVDAEFNIINCLSVSDVLEAANKYLGNDEPGGIIVLEVERRNYSFGEINRLVETNDAYITQLNTFVETHTGLVLVTIKINKKEISDIVATFQRFEYGIRYFLGEEHYNNELKDNYENLLSFLKV